MKVLIIEDDKIIRHALNRVFTARGHEVFLAKDGKEGVDTWQKQKPHLVLLDVIMPHLTGVQILEMREDLPEAKVVVMSAYTGDQYNFKTLKNLSDLIISKPFGDIFQLIQKLESMTKSCDELDLVDIQDER